MHEKMLNLVINKAVTKCKYYIAEGNTREEDKMCDLPPSNPIYRGQGAWCDENPDCQFKQGIRAGIKEANNLRIKIACKGGKL